MKIKRVIGREIFDSRGLPTIECELVLDNGATVLASVPAGSSTGIHEAKELRDPQRLLGKGVAGAVEVIEKQLAPLLLGKAPDVIDMDLKMIALDGTIDKHRLGANSILAASMAITKAQALAEDMQLYELIAHLYGSGSVSLPFPLFNMINGGVHADNNLRIQEFMVMPTEGNSFREAMEQGVLVFQKLKELLKKSGKTIAVGDEGGFASRFESETEALDFLTTAIEAVNPKAFKIALDVAASEFYDPATKQYNWNGTPLSSDGLIDYYSMLLLSYPIFSIEDGLAQDDWDGWIEMNKRLGGIIQLVGDDLFTTNSERIFKGIQTQAANAVLIKPNQIGTITETLQAVQLAQEHSLGVVISHRSGETEDTFIADLAVGTSAGQIKTGGCSRGERIAKYNRLLRIEDNLMLSLLEQ